MRKIINKKIKLFENYVLKMLKEYFQLHRLRIYIIGSLVLVLVVISEIPYLNLIVVPFKDLLIVYLLIFVLVGPVWRSLLIIGIISFIPLIIITLLGNEALAEQVANIIYLVLFTSTVLLVKEIIQNEN